MLEIPYVAPVDASWRRMETHVTCDRVKSSEYLVGNLAGQMELLVSCLSATRKIKINMGANRMTET